MTYELALLEREELGEERGKEKGRLELIKNLFNVGTPIQYIVKATGWSEEKLLEFKKSHVDSPKCAEKPPSLDVRRKGA